MCVIQHTAVTVRATAKNYLRTTYVRVSTPQQRRVTTAHTRPLTRRRCLVIAWLRDRRIGVIGGVCATKHGGGRVQHGGRLGRFDSHR
jgi:hypothetical protein